MESGERATAVRRALADKHALLLIDNVETFAGHERTRLYQFLSRLPTSCKAVVTSRRRAGVDARVVRLDRLDRDSALDLIREPGFSQVLRHRMGWRRDALARTKALAKDFEGAERDYREASRNRSKVE